MTVKLWVIKSHIVLVHMYDASVLSALGLLDSDRLSLSGVGNADLVITPRQHTTSVQDRPRLRLSQGACWVPLQPLSMGCSSMV